MEDPRRLRRTLEQRLTLNSDLRKNFLAALEEHLQLPGVLHAALKPMRVTTPGLPLTGDSFVRLLLNVAPIQADLASSLLERLPEFIDEADEEKDVATLLLGQFRWCAPAALVPVAACLGQPYTGRASSLRTALACESLCCRWPLPPLPGPLSAGWTRSRTATA